MGEGYEGRGEEEEKSWYPQFLDKSYASTYYRPSNCNAD